MTTKLENLSSRAASHPYFSQKTTKKQKKIQTTKQQQQTITHENVKIYCCLCFTRWLLILNKYHVNCHTAMSVHFQNVAELRLLCTIQQSNLNKVCHLKTKYSSKPTWRYENLQPSSITISPGRMLSIILSQHETIKLPNVKRNVTIINPTWCNRQKRTDCLWLVWHYIIMIITLNWSAFVMCGYIIKI